MSWVLGVAFGGGRPEQIWTRLHYADWTVTGNGDPGCLENRSATLDSDDRGGSSGGLSYDCPVRLRWVSRQWVSRIAQGQEPVCE